MIKLYKTTCFMAILLLVFNASANETSDEKSSLIKTTAEICTEFKQLNDASKIDMSDNINMAMMKRCSQETVKLFNDNNYGEQKHDDSHSDSEGIPETYNQNNNSELNNQNTHNDGNHH